jgi:di/tricarboxylate transporter
VERPGGSVDPGAGGTYAAGDHLRLRGTLRDLLRLASRSGLEMRRPEGRGQPAAVPESGPDAEPPASKGMVMTELVVLPGSALIGRTIEERRFADRHDAVLLALHRPGEEVYEPLQTTPIHAGDVLVVEGRPEALAALAEKPGFLLVGTPEHPVERPRHVGIAVGTLAGVVIMASLGVMPIVTAATAGCAVLMLTGCLKPREAYQAIDWSIIFLLAGALALGTSLEKTGLTDHLARFLTGLSGHAGPFVVLAAFFFVSVLISELMSNSGTVLLLGPIAISTAQVMGLNPTALMAAITFGASAAFAMPIGYQTSLMIYGPGGYRFRDYVRMGIPLDLILAALALWLIPAYWPLQTP